MCYPPMSDNMLTLCIGITRSKVRSGNNNGEVADRAILGFLLAEQNKRTDAKVEAQIQAAGLIAPPLQGKSDREMLHEQLTAHGIARLGVNVFTSRGAIDDFFKPEVKLEAQRARLDRDGYDEMGSYWGVGEPLWWVTTEDNSWSINLRARTAHSAIARARVLYDGRAK
jgi:hypothetical protein